MSFRAGFLIVAASAIFHISFWPTLALVVGYGICADIDKWRAKRAKNHIFDDEIFGWSKDADDPTIETKGEIARFRLDGKEQIIVVRILESLTRMPGTPS